jgi:hypothetical protein
MEEGFYQRLPIQCVFPYIVTVRQRIKEQDQVEAGEEMREACWRRLTCSKEIR